MHRDPLIMVCTADIVGRVRGKGFPAEELASRLVKAVGPDLIATFTRNKRYELDRWNAQQLRLTAWEIEEYAEALAALRRRASSGWFGA